MESKIIKVFLAVALFLCLLRMPLWYYQLIRIFGTIGFAYLSYLEYEDKRKGWFYIYGSCAIVLNPVKEISFDKHTWEYVDVIMAAILLVNFIALYKTFLLQVLKSTKESSILMAKKMALPLVILIGLAGIAVGLPWAINSIFPKPPTLYQSMLMLKTQLNKESPKMLDSMTRWDSMSVQGKNFIYHYTLVDDEFSKKLAESRWGLYGTLVADGYKLPNLTEFSLKLDTLRILNTLYNNLVEDKYDVASFQDFEAKVSSSDYKMFQQNVKQRMVQKLKNSKYMSMYKDNNVSWRHYYSSSSGEFVVGVVISPSDYK